MKTGLRVIDAMTREALSVSPDTTVLKCAEIMKEEHVGNLIVKEKGKLTGIVTEQDLVYKIIADAKNPESTKVSQVMTPDVITITPEKDITEAMIKMSELGVRRLPVVEEGNVVGVLTMKDILKIEPHLFELVVDKIQLREEESKPIKRIDEKEGLCEFCGNYAPFLFEQEDSLVCRNCRE